jgi:biotin transporter BioY
VRLRVLGNERRISVRKIENFGRMPVEPGDFRGVFIPVAISLLAFAATFAEVPFYPVPFTLQTLALPLVCLFSSRKHTLQGVALFAMYRVMQAGAGIFLTIGYIAGFFAMAWILTSKRRVRGP